VIERDATGLAMAKADVKPAVAAILADMGFNGGWSAEPGKAPLISLRGLPRPAAALVRKLQRAGLEVELLDLTSATGIATIACTISEPQGLPTVMNACSGCGTHPDARIALTRALTEAAQSRLTGIQGGGRICSSFRQAGTADRSRMAANHRFRRNRLIGIHQVRRVGSSSSGCGTAASQVVSSTSRGGSWNPRVRAIVPRSEAWTLFCGWRPSKSDLGRCNKSGERRWTFHPRRPTRGSDDDRIHGIDREAVLRLAPAHAPRSSAVTLPRRRLRCPCHCRRRSDRIVGDSKENLAVLGGENVGASSMGRCASNWTSGMIGVNWVYDYFRAVCRSAGFGCRTRLFPFDFKPMTVPMVDLVLDGTDSAAGLIPDRKRPLCPCPDIFFADRTPDRLMSCCAARRRRR
jgi:hypothetical protein